MQPGGTATYPERPLPPPALHPPHTSRLDTFLLPKYPLPERSVPSAAPKLRLGGDGCIPRAEHSLATAQASPVEAPQTKGASKRGCGLSRHCCLAQTISAPDRCLPTTPEVKDGKPVTSWETASLISHRATNFSGITLRM